MKKKSRAYNRRMSYLKARRKQRLDHESSAGRWSPYYNNLHQYSKNKIHCSCPMCSQKTKANRHKSYKEYWGYHKHGPYNYSRKDLRRQLSMDYSEEEYNNPTLWDYADLWEDFYLLSIKG